MPLTISIEADGNLRLCNYVPFQNSKHRHSVLDLGKSFGIDDYIRWWYDEHKLCPGCLWACQCSSCNFLKEVHLSGKIFEKVDAYGMIVDMLHEESAE